jgi:hypothetical protein
LVKKIVLARSISAGLRFDERAADAGSHQVQKRLIVVVHYQVRTDAADKQPEGVVARCARDRHGEQLL